MPGPEQVETFLLVFVRCLTFWSLGPLLADQRVPGQVKILGALVTSIALYPTVPSQHWVLEHTLLGYALLVGREIVMGAALGIAGGLVFVAVRMAGSLMGVQMGFSIANIFDPKTRTEVSLIGEVQELLAVFLFLLVNGHHLFFRALSTSLEVVPPGGALDLARLSGTLLPMAGTVFLTTVQVGAPILGALFLTDAALGFVARAVPQMNVFIVGIPIKIGVGMTLLVVTAPLFARFLTLHFSRVEGHLLAILHGM